MFKTILSKPAGNESAIRPFSKRIIVDYLQRRDFEVALACVALLDLKGRAQYRSADEVVAASAQYAQVRHSLRCNAEAHAHKRARAHANREYIEISLTIFTALQPARQEQLVRILVDTNQTEDRLLKSAPNWVGMRECSVEHAGGDQRRRRGCGEEHATTGRGERAYRRERGREAGREGAQQRARAGGREG
eukprot:6199633-Pleurochrysis_carterae.AAC.3